MDARTVKVRSSHGSVNQYVRVVEAYREGGKVKQRVVADLGRKDVLVEILPKLQRLLAGEQGTDDRDPADPHFGDAPTRGPILGLRALFDPLRLREILDQHLGHAKEVPFADRAFALIANRLIAPASEHGLAGWLETDFVCDRQGRRLVPHWSRRRRVRVHPRQRDARYRTLDPLHAAKDQIEVAPYHRLRDLFSLEPDLVSYDITSTDFEGAGPADLAKHGHSRDGKSQDVQVIVGAVMVAGWPIAHHVWAGNRIDHSTVESGFRQLKDVMALRPIFHQSEPRVRAHIFVAAPALLVQRLLGRRLKDAGVDLSPARAMQALSTVRLVTSRLEGQPERRGVTGGCPDARLVLKALRLTDQRPPTPPRGQLTVM